MLKIVTTLLRGAASEAEEALFDANAIRVLEQQLRDAAGSLEHARRELACAMAHQASEERAVSALEARIGSLEAAAHEALDAAREDLATEVATVIAATEDERALRKASVEKFAVDVRRLKQLSEDGRLRLADLRRGLEMARAQEALRRAGGTAVARSVSALAHCAKRRQPLCAFAMSRRAKKMSPQPWMNSTTARAAATSAIASPRPASGASRKRSPLTFSRA